MQLVPYPSLRDVVAESGPLWAGAGRPRRPARPGGSDPRRARRRRPASRRQAGQRPPWPGRSDLPHRLRPRCRRQQPLRDRGGDHHGVAVYMAPERARAQPATPATDLWALGATLYAAVEGRDPFERNGTMAVLTAIVADEPDAPARAGVLWPVISGLSARIRPRGWAPTRPNTSSGASARRPVRQRTAGRPPVSRYLCRRLRPGLPLPVRLGLRRPGPRRPGPRRPGPLRPGPLRPGPLRPGPRMPAPRMRPLRMRALVRRVRSLPHRRPPDTTP